MSNDVLFIISPAVSGYQADINLLSPMIDDTIICPYIEIVSAQVELKRPRWLDKNKKTCLLHKQALTKLYVFKNAVKNKPLQHVNVENRETEICV